MKSSAVSCSAGEGEAAYPVSSYASEQDVHVLLFDEPIVFMHRVRIGDMKRRHRRAPVVLRRYRLDRPHHDVSLS